MAAKKCLKALSEQAVQTIDNLINGMIIEHTIHMELHFFIDHVFVFRAAAVLYNDYVNLFELLQRFSLHHTMKVAVSDDCKSLRGS